MLGFLKKFKKSKENKKEGSSTPEVENKDDSVNGEDAEAGKKKKKKFSLKLIIIILLILVAVGASGFVVYMFYFKPGSGEDQVPVYQKVELQHLQLPDEILEFSFSYLPQLYDAFLVYNNEMNLLDAEIKRIEDISQQYPEQKKIADKEKKVWEKTRSGLEKSFLKIQKPVKETYVLFRVNKEQGLAQIEAKASELAGLAKTALDPVQTMTDKLKSKEEIPQGMVKGTLYKLKKKFL